MAVLSTAESHKEVTWPSTQAAAAAQAKAVAKERDDLRALNEQVMRNQAALRQHNTALQEEEGRAAAQVQDLQEQVLLCGRLRAVCTQLHAQQRLPQRPQICQRPDLLEPCCTAVL